MLSVETVESPTAPRPAHRRRTWSLAAWVTAVLGFCVTRGLPLDRTTQTLAIVALLLALDVGSPWRHKARVLLDWLPFIGLLYLYDYTRGLASWFGAPTHVVAAIHADQALTFGHVPTVSLQLRLYDPGHVHWWDVVTSLTYVSHFFLAWVIAVSLYVRSREQWSRWVRRLLLLSFAGLVTFIAVPAAPPWYAAKLGLLPPVERLTGRGWEVLHLHAAAGLVERGQAAANNVAAVPSLHAALPLLVTVFFWGTSARWLRVVMLAYTATMACSLVYGGEHYLVDVLLGYVYVGLTVVVVAAWEHRRSTPDDPAPGPVGSGQLWTNRT